MDSARADILAARHRLHTRGWIPRNAEAFRHLPPPGAEVWLGDTPPAIACAAHPLAGAGWTLHPIGHGPQGRVDARWLDAGDALQRAELFAGLTMPAGVHDAGDSDAAPFAWAHRALCRQGLRLRIGGTPGADRGPPDTALAAASPPAAQRRRGAAAGDRGARGRALRAGRDTRPSATGLPAADRAEPAGPHQAGRRRHAAAPSHRDAGCQRPHRTPRARPPRPGARYEHALLASGSGYHLQRTRDRFA
jgi:Fe-S cluster assembly protein SufD